MKVGERNQHLPDVFSRVEADEFVILFTSKHDDEPLVVLPGQVPSDILETAGLDVREFMLACLDYRACVVSVSDESLREAGLDAWSGYARGILATMIAKAFLAGEAWGSREPSFRVEP